MEENTCSIALYVKDTYMSVFKETFQVMRSAPYKVTLTEKQNIVSALPLFIF